MHTSLERRNLRYEEKQFPLMCKHIILCISSETFEGSLGLLPCLGWVGLSHHSSLLCHSVPVFDLRQLVPDHHHISLPHRDTVDSDQFKREEDFYYTEVQMKEEAAAAGTPAADPAPTPGMTSPPLALLPPPPPKTQSSGPEHPGLESYLPSGALSKSAPGSFWHIQADHAYQVWDWWTLGAQPCGHEDVWCLTCHWSA